MSETKHICKPSCHNPCLLDDPVRPANYQTDLAPSHLAEQIFFYVLLKGGKDNPLQSISSKWFCDLAAPRIRELLTPNDSKRISLIAAAPELLYALEAIIESATDGRDVPEWISERIEVAQRAIWKAQGKL